MRKGTRKSNRAKNIRNSGELHQTGSGLTTNQGLPLSDNQNSLKGGTRGATLLEDFILREKITHFDHERIPERVVHARGSAAHGYFQAYKNFGHLTRADFLCDAKVRTPVFARFSTVAGGAGSADLPRDVRGFAVKFYTREGNFDLVGNNIPVFFVQDAMKFPDLVHAVKMEADRGYPQAASAHDTFWDFVSLVPESMHMLLWVMSDRGLPRSLRMMEGFGVNTFRLINLAGEQRFVKFHWRPVLGTAAVVWEEAVRINGVDSDYHRRDLYEAIKAGHFPEFELGLQVVDQATAQTLPFDILDATKLIPEEIVPLQMVGKMVLDRNVDNFFAETEQVAFCPSNLVPGIAVSEDPLLQGRLFSYLDTQLSRLGTPNFHQLPINQPKCPFANMQRDGMMQNQTPRGRANYEPNSLEPGGPRESETGYDTPHAANYSSLGTERTRLRPTSFADHYSQARLFYRSVTEVERRHLTAAFAFELGKVSLPVIRERMLSHLHVVEPELARNVAEKLGMLGKLRPVAPAVPPVNLILSPALRLYGKYPPTLRGRRVGILLGEGFGPDTLDQLLQALQQEQAMVTRIAPHIGGVKDATGKLHLPDEALCGAPSVLFDAVVVLGGLESDSALRQDPHGPAFLQEAYQHCKVIGLEGVPQLAATLPDRFAPGIFQPEEQEDWTAAFVAAAKEGKCWDRA